MSLWSKLIKNHVLTNLTFVLVIVVGTVAYFKLPRQQDPTVNFNWIKVFTFMPGASAEEVEKRITDPIEDAVRKVPDIKFSLSSSRAGASMVLVRFNEMSDETFDKRLNDLRREVQNKQRELPDTANDPFIYEITSSNGFPTAMLVVSSQDSGDHLHTKAREIKRELERIKGVDAADPTGWREAQLQIRFYPDRLVSLGVNPSDIMKTVATHFRNVSAGEYDVNNNSWLVQVLGANPDPTYLGQLPIVTKAGEIRLDRVADISFAREKATELVDYEGKPSVMISVTKKPNTNVIKLLTRIKDYVTTRNKTQNLSGVTISLVHDETFKTRQALNVMQTNALYGLLLVLLTAWLFLGFKVAIMTSIGIPFILACTFIALTAVGETLNITVLLGVVISLGMLVDDAVVVVESIYYRIQRGMDGFNAAMEALKEVAVPVTAAVLTTCAAFLPLMLLPGVIGKFMKVVPMVVCLALAASLIEAFWMLPSHMLGMRAKTESQLSQTEKWRMSALHWLRLKYTRILTKLMRRPFLTLFVTFSVLVSAVAGGLYSGRIKMDFFASDPSRLFFVSVYMPSGGSLENAHEVVKEVKSKLEAELSEEESNSLVSYAGLMFTETSMFTGNQYAQIMVSLKPKQKNGREVGEIMEALRPVAQSVKGTKNVTFFNVKGGPPATSPVEIKVKGNDLDEIHVATAELETLMQSMPELKDVEIDEGEGQKQFNLTLDLDAIQRARMNPSDVANTLRLLVDGSQAASTRYKGEELNVYVQAADKDSIQIEDILNFRLTSPTGQSIPLKALTQQTKTVGMGKIRHYKFKRAVTIKANIDKTLTNERQINAKIKQIWADQYQEKHPNTSLDFSGMLDDLNETISNLKFYFLFGVGLIYIILGTQFKSYFQPFLIISTVPLAFCGVIIGLVITGNPLSLMGLYGIVALAGIAVNASIVLISAANDRLAAGMSVNHAIIYAARRRVVPIIITALTTIAGLFSLATGLGGSSLIWGPVATAIVWGLSISTLLTLFIIPILYRLFMSITHRKVSH